MSRLSKESSFHSVASTSQEGQEEEEAAGLPPNEPLRVTLLSSEWKSSKGGLSTINRELAIQLAKQPNVEVSVYLPQCSEEDKKVARDHNVQLIEAEKLPGYEPVDWLASIPENHTMDCIIGHGVHLGRQIPLIKRQRHHAHCKWIQVVHTAPEELGMFKCYADAISKGEKKHQIEVELCERADQVVAVGPKLADAYSRYLRSCQKDQEVLNLTPSIFTEFSEVKQATEERDTFYVLVFGRGDSEDFELKGYDIAAQAVAELKDNSYHLMFVGAPSGKEESIKEKLLQHGISRRQLTVRGFDESRERLSKLLCEVDLTIMPSRTEGFGLTALEALSAGLPVLVSGNSGLGKALKKVLHGSNCVVDSEDPKEWAKAIRAVCEKDRDVRLAESKDLCEKYSEKYSWQKPCGVLLDKMLNLTFDSSKEQTSSKNKRPVNTTSAPQKSGLLTKGSSKKKTLAKGRKSSLGSAQVRKQPRSLTAAHKVPSRLQSSAQGKRPSTCGTQSLKRKRIETDGHKGLSGKGTSTTSRKRSRLSADRDGGNGLSVVLRLLKAEYNRRSLLKPLLWENTFKLPLEDVYTRLSIVSRRKTDFQLQSNEVNMYEIFKTLNKGEDAMVLVEGSPGIGKTTFCLKLSYDWANEKIPKEFSFPVFQLVLLLKCRDIQGDVMEAISEQLLPEDTDEKFKKEIMDYIKDFHNQEKILIILDGLDELPRTAEKHVDKLLHRRILPFCYVLATSRQERGIVVRQQVDFDILLQIKGFTKKDAFDYIKKHFSHFGPEHLSKGKRLIKAIKEKSFLHALRSNPLNLLLLCVVFEHHQGELPSSRTELYQIIVQCLLRRYCAKHNLEAPDDGKALEKQFEDSLLALGELAWRCLQEDRFSFREEELARFESNIKDLAARKLGLVFKEASVKRINPQHEYHFFHKTFQEYLAATYLTHKILKEQLNVFREYGLDFRTNIVHNYRQVFFFVSGILGVDASVLFGQIGEMLESEPWDWLKCNKREATFFTESFIESRNAEQVAMAFCNFIPFPLTVNINASNVHNANFLTVVNACQSFSQLQHPLHLTVEIHRKLQDFVVNSVLDFLESWPPFTLSFSIGFLS
ncbi:hypothetical protein ACROYT_G042902 [Oculina patagonica]